MSESTAHSEPNQTRTFNCQFGEEIIIEDSGFSFRPILNLELEIDGSVYMYSEQGSLEIYLMGGTLESDLSITDLNAQLTAEVMEHLGDYTLQDLGTDTVHNVSGFINEIHFSTSEDDGTGRALICSPFINQYFFCLVVATSEFWNRDGQKLFDAIKSHVQFHSLSKPEIINKKVVQHPDLTIETFGTITADEDFLLTINKGDLSLLLAARSTTPKDKVCITGIHAPDGKQLYHYDPDSNEFESSLFDQPLLGENGEVCFFYPRNSQQSLVPGDYRLAFQTDSGNPIQQVQIIIRTGRALDLQMIDLNFWFALEHEYFPSTETLVQFEKDMSSALSEQFKPLNILPGKIAYFQAAPDEIASFSTINLDTDLLDCSYMISESTNSQRALNIGVVEEFLHGSPPTPANINAISSGSPGMILTSASPNSCILIKWPSFKDDLQELAKAIIQQLIVFSGIDTRDTRQDENSRSLILNKEIAWRLRRHPLFYDGG